MTLYLRLKLKELLTNPELLGWGVGFVEFWVFMWFFVFSAGTRVETAWEAYVAKISLSLSYSFLSLISMASIAISLAYSVLYTSRSARYLTKFTRASPALLMLEEFLASLAVVIVFVAVIALSAAGCAYLKWRVTPSLSNPAGVLVDLILGGTALYWFSYTVALAIIVSRRTRAISMASFLPLILAFVAYSQLWVDFGKLVYLVPFSTLPALLVYHSTGIIPPTGSYLRWLAGRTAPSINLRLAAISLFAWILAFAATSLVLLRKSRGVPIEEIRL